MKTDLEIKNGMATISTPDGTYVMIIDIMSGEVVELNYTETTLHNLVRFVTKAKTRYNKLLNSKIIDDFIR